MQIIHQHLNFVIVCTFHFQRQNSCINHSSQNVYGLLFCSIKSSGFNEESLEIMLNWWETWALSLTSWILRYPKILKRISFGNGQDLWKPGKHVNSVFRTDFTTYSCDWFLLFFIKDLKIPEKFFIQWFPKMTSSVNRNVVHCGIILCAFRGIKLANVWGILFFFWKKGRNEFNWMVMDVSSNHELSRKRRAKSKLLFFSSY